MLNLMMSLALYKTSKKGCPVPGRQNRSIRKNEEASPAVDTRSPVPSNRHTKYRYMKKLEALFEPPLKCCDLYSEEKYNCIIHLREPPYEYYQKLCAQALTALKRSYRVDLFVFNKRCEREFRALHMERRRTLGLQDLHEEQDFPHLNPRTRKEMRKLVGKLCIFHRLDCNAKHCPRGVMECFMCKCDVASKRHRLARQQLYADYRKKVYSTLDDIHKTMGYDLFQIDDPDIDPNKELAPDVTRTNAALYITDWIENQQGRTGNLISYCRDDAQIMAQRKAKIWSRMAGKGENETTKSISGVSRVLNTIVEEGE